MNDDKENNKSNVSFDETKNKIFKIKSCCDNEKETREKIKEEIRYLLYKCNKLISYL
jgi:hypothetical protein